MAHFTMTSLMPLMLLIDILTLSPSSKRMIHDGLSAKIDKRADVADAHTLMSQMLN